MPSLNDGHVSERSYEAWPENSYISTSTSPEELGSSASVSSPPKAPTGFKKFMNVRQFANSMWQSSPVLPGGVMEKEQSQGVMPGGSIVPSPGGFFSRSIVAHEAPISISQSQALPALVDRIGSTEVRW